MAVKDNLNSVGGGKTSFVWRAQSIAGSINLKRNGKILKMKGVGGTGTAAKTLSINVYGTTADNLVPYNAGSLPLTFIGSATVHCETTEVDFDVSGYDRFVLYCVYGSGTIGTGNDAVYVQLEN